MNVPVLDNPVDTDGLEEIWEKSEFDQCCDGEGCDCEATFFVRVRRPCNCRANHFFLCQPHLDALLELEKRAKGGELVCIECGEPAFIISVSSIK